MVHSGRAKSVVRVSTGAGSSTASLKPNVPAHGWLPFFGESERDVQIEVARGAVRRAEVVMLRFSRRSNGVASASTLAYGSVLFCRPV